ncbi:MAG: NAD(P)/FAD-dependent oxidoreductase [Sneathiellaceae bacterium]
MTAAIFIAGAGPTGLTAALALRRLGRDLRIVDKAPAPARESRALAVNPRSLELLEPLGVTERLLAEGLRLTHLQLHDGRAGRDRILRDLPLNVIPHRFPFMLAIPQGRVEAILEAALSEAGLAVERGTALTALAEPARPRLTLCGAQGEAQVDPDLVLAADGAHSRVRHQLDLPFPGRRYEADWLLADYRLDCALAPDAAHIFLQPDGFLFMAPVSPGVWRAMTTHDPVADALPPGCRIQETVWQASFRISHRIVPRFQAGAVFLAGDAAHLHSPLGARGMNLGIEDAMVFAHLAADGRLAQYHARRHRVDSAVVRQIDLLTRVVTGAAPLSRAMRDRLLPLASGIPALQGVARRRAMGLVPSGGWD